VRTRTDLRALAFALADSASAYFTAFSLILGLLWLVVLGHSTAWTEAQTDRSQAQAREAPANLANCSAWLLHDQRALHVGMNRAEVLVGAGFRKGAHERVVIHEPGGAEGARP